MSSAAPSEDELLTFVGALLSNLSRDLREPDVLTEAIREHRDMWVMLYRASSGFESGDAGSATDGRPGAAPDGT